MLECLRADICTNVQSYFESYTTIQNSLLAQECEQCNRKLQRPAYLSGVYNFILPHTGQGKGPECSGLGVYVLCFVVARVPVVCLKACQSLLGPLISGGEETPFTFHQSAVGASKRKVPAVFILFILHIHSLNTRQRVILVL